MDHEYIVLLVVMGGSPDHLAPVRSRPAVAAEDQAPSLVAAVGAEPTQSLVAAAVAEGPTPFPVVVCEWTRPAAVGNQKSLLQLQEALLRRGILKVGP